MPFQIVELALDSNDNVVERRVVPYPYQTREEAVDTIESVVTRFAEAGYEPEGDFWWAIGGDGETRVRFIIEGCLRLLSCGRRLRQRPL
jgi:hypothetical protein